jgi:two-component system LytT family response regulator
MTYRALIVDDEAPAREKIAQFLARTPHDFQVEMAGNAKTALEQINTQSFDLMFLDIQMPQMNAFDMLRQLDLEKWPPIIFSTAYHQYALQAFEVHAIDYLLKPYDFDRFQTALKRVLQLIDQQKNPQPSLEQLLKNWQPPNSDPVILWVNQGSKIVPLEVSIIEYLESDGNYVMIQTADHRYALKQSLQELQTKLDGRQFIRIHRSFVVNKRMIREMYPKSHGDLFAVLKSGRKVPVSRRYKDQLLV